MLRTEIGGIVADPPAFAAPHAVGGREQRNHIWRDRPRALDEDADRSLAAHRVDLVTLSE